MLCVWKRSAASPPATPGTFGAWKGTGCDDYLVGLYLAVVQLRTKLPLARLSERTALPYWIGSSNAAAYCSRYAITSSRDG